MSFSEELCQMLYVLQKSGSYIVVPDDKFDKVIDEIFDGENHKGITSYAIRGIRIISNRGIKIGGGDE